MTASFNSTKFTINSIIAVVAVAFMILGAKSCTTKLNPRESPSEISIFPPEIPAPTQDPTLPLAQRPLLITDNVIERRCGSEGKIISVVFVLEISGGIPPYHLEFAPGAAIIENIKEKTKVSFKLGGGKSLTVSIKSNTIDGSPMWSQDFHAPSIAPECEPDFPTPPPTTISPTIPDSGGGAPPTRAAEKPDPIGTFISAIFPTNPQPVSTSNTSIPPTNAGGLPSPATDIIPSTIIASPGSGIPTAVPPTIISQPGNSHACSNGIDDDGDGFVDLQDPQCKGPNDNQEDK